MSAVYGDIDVLSRTIYGEARGEGGDGMAAVAWVIKNRTKKPVPFGVGWKGVCMKPKQFSCWNPNDPNRDIIMGATLELPGYRQAYATALLVYDSKIPDSTKGADHYHTIAKPSWAEEWPPYWAKGMTETARLGGHVFLRSE